MKTSFRDSIISQLQVGQAVDELADLCVYPSNALFVVGFIPADGPVNTQGLTPGLAQQLVEEGEINEYFETPEGAADCYLSLRAKYGGSVTRLETEG